MHMSMFITFTWRTAVGSSRGKRREISPADLGGRRTAWWHCPCRPDPWGLIEPHLGPRRPPARPSTIPPCPRGALCWRGHVRSAPRPSDVLAAIDVQFRTVHVARLLRTQEMDGLGHFLRLTQTPQRDLVVHQPLGPR